MKKRNKKSKSVGNGEGSLYYSEALGLWVFQYFDDKGKRKTIKQKKKQTVKDFKAEVTRIKQELNKGTYIGKDNTTLKSIIESHIEQKFNDGTISEVSKLRNNETLHQLERCCGDFINKPIQKINFKNLQECKDNMRKKYSQSCINKQWLLLEKAFAIASSPSIHLIPVNIMQDENLKKPISNKATKKVYPLKPEERKKLNYVLDYKERNHPYRNIVKMEWLTAMRIGEVLARSKKDINKDKTTIYIHNTLTKNVEGKIIMKEHTKTYNKTDNIDSGIRYFPITGELKEIINTISNAKISNIYGLLFWDYKHNTFISHGEINSWLDRINEKYKISDKKLHNHRLRHDRITQWKENGMDEKAIQYLIGHVEGSDVTNEYIDVSQEFAFKEYNKAK